jgi:cyclomaltodextrinase / maltogenic alpha-amylase / neopullulanase
MENEKEFVPEWSKNVVWYQIFPERFHNGDKNNDPTVESIKGSWPHDHTSPWEIHPWTSDWYQLLPYEQRNGKDIWFNIQRRRYGGDLQGIIEKLDYLQDLGITAIYLNPVFEAPSSHKYDGATYHHIDPYFGPDPAGDKEMIKNEKGNDPSTWVWTKADILALTLIKEVHNRGMKIIFDGVFNHMGINSWAFKDVVEKQELSEYKDWFSIQSFRNKEKGTEFIYNGWFGVNELPELNEDENGIVDGPKRYIFDITKRWMDPDGDGDPSDGIDGWRLDVAFCVQHQFWKEWRKQVKNINPEAYLTAEVIDPIPVVAEYLKGDEFDAVMNYNFAFTSAEFFINEKKRIPPAEFDAKLNELRNAFPGGVEYVQQNLFGSHDANRIASHIVNKDLGDYRNWGEYFGLSKGDNPKYDTRKPTPEEYDTEKLFVIFQMTYVGAPMVYYGDEAGMWGANDPDCRKPMVWNDLEYDDEKFLPDQSLRNTPDKVEFNKDLYEHYKKLIAIRNENKALRTGSYKTLLADNDKEIFIFERDLDEDKIIVVINNSSSPREVELNVEHKEYFSDLLNNEIINTGNGKLKIITAGKWGRILKKDYYKY